ncbi:MAG TPA: TetR/AcrR family transcriptional regulator [Jiangellales bacterium]|nr:TetR/AcrR family transcriptional regulator [Jiangellales bacterium]
MSPDKRSAETTTQLRSALIEHARRLIAREGAAALTMRALATEAGCAVGLPYKVFADRHEIVAAIVHTELDRLRAARDELIQRAGSGTVGGNLAWFAAVFLDSPAVALTQELLADEALRQSVTATAHDNGMGPSAFPRVLSRYLAAEKQAGRVAPDTDEDAFGFLIASALHNLLVAGEAWPRPTRPELEQILTATATAIAAAR